ncbi:MAG: retroviral-like aspartic protease family protein [Gomphosphaeria aponina SAG 52.96 = DSM 107014]|uniref:Retroviral-like aspartic protease family protein n=1 Tax=Gomphosphaeria aponina SAG 52.96 = DSM 107014 TaxID=1521640 RepID=A0A941JQA5_9CHRO|nr:retroviral-like aspartic protease family protein [Gomphosphaeria aponina SAG 52.96 = DSM 107014]
MLDANGQQIDLGYLCGEENSPQPNSTPGEFQVRIKRREAGIPVIDVTFNGKHTFEMMVDTGASGTVLTPEMAAILAVKQEGVIIVHTPSENNVPFPTGRVAMVAVGGVVAKDVLVAIAPALPIGLLGQDFFGNYDVIIRENVIEFHVR